MEVGLVITTIGLFPFLLLLHPRSLSSPSLPLIPFLPSPFSPSPLIISPNTPIPLKLV